MSGPMQWNPRTGKLVPITNVALILKDVDDDEPLGAAIPQLFENETLTAPSKPKAKKEKATTPKNIVALAKARLKEVKQELRRMQALEKECGELERLIAAAEDTKPRAVVRALTKTAG